jgi:thioredoxin reductase (NADPH)
MLKVYSKNNCPFCDKAKHYLKTNGFEYEEVKIDETPEAREWLMAEGHRTVPQIYHNDKLFVEGGYQGLAKLNPEQIQEKLGVN